MRTSASALANGLVLAVLVLAGCAGKTGHEQRCEDNAGPEIYACDDFFAPTSATAKAGSPVHWENAGNDHHTVTIQNVGSTTPGDTLKDSGDLAHGATFDYTFATSGTYHVYCRYHSQGASGVFDSQMVMTVTVT